MVTPFATKCHRDRVARRLLIASCLLWAVSAPAVATEPVMPCRLPPLRPELSSIGDRFHHALLLQSRFLLKQVRPWRQQPSMKLLTDSQSSEHWIRPNTSSLVGFATLYRWGPYDAGKVGVSRDALLSDYIVPMMRYLVSTHVTGDRVTSDGQAWGDAWQSAHWTFALARAGWFVWDDLPSDVRSGLRRVVAHEAQRFVDAVPPTGMKHDTKAEENAWNSRVLLGAVSLMPDDPRRPRWEAAFLRWAISAFMRPSDEHSQVVVDGRRVADWYVGPCVLEDFTLENHGFVHSGYMGCISIPLGCHLDYRLSGRKAPGTLDWNAAPIYDNLKFLVAPDGAYQYPSGQDWSPFRTPQKAFLHLLMAGFGGDPDGWSLLQSALETTERMQARTPSGAAFLPDEFFFPSVQHDTAERLALQWIALHLVDEIIDRPTEKTGVLHLPDGKLLLQRTADAFISVSYGSKVLAQIVPLSHDRLINPDFRSLVGQVHMAGGGPPPEPTVIDAAISTQESSFTAQLTIRHGPEVEAKLTLTTSDEGVLTVSEQLTARVDTEIKRVATGLVGILNNKQWVYETGERTVTLGDAERVVASGSGVYLSAQTDRVVIDDKLEIRLNGPRLVAYAAATGPVHGRIADRLNLNLQEDPRRYRAGEQISAYKATLRVLPNDAD